MDNKHIALEEKISEMLEDGLCIAFSGGVDSSLLLKIASDIGKKNSKDLHAVTFETKLHPVSDIKISKKVAEEMGARHTIIQIDELNNDQILKNPPDRCYLCKKYLFENILKFAQKNKLKYVIDGTNADDIKTYRPGIKALKELNIISPLASLDISKEEVRKIASDLNISVASRPSTPCMATRLPYGTEINYDLLAKIEKGENYIKGLGFGVVRLRVHNDIVRIEVEKKDFPRFIENGDKLVEFLKKLGFSYITLDVEGFRSGSMDIHINERG